MALKTSYEFTYEEADRFTCFLVSIIEFASCFDGRFDRNGSTAKRCCGLIIARLL